MRTGVTVVQLSRYPVVMASPSTPRTVRAPDLDMRHRIAELVRQALRAGVVRGRPVVSGRRDKGWRVARQAA